MSLLPEMIKAEADAWVHWTHELKKLPPMTSAEKQEFANLVLEKYGEIKKQQRQGV